jgi:putative membrane protein
MELKLTFAILHLMALAIGIAAVYARWRGLRKLTSADGLPDVFHADNWYGAAALIWIGTGLMRAFGGLEKGTEHYLANHWFLGKMGLFGMVLLLELWPMVNLVQWRMALRKERPLRLDRAPTMAVLTLLQIPLLLVMVFMAAAMARGL